MRTEASAQQAITARVCASKHPDCAQAGGRIQFRVRAALRGLRQLQKDSRAETGGKIMEISTQRDRKVRRLAIGWWYSRRRLITRQIVGAVVALLVASFAGCTYFQEQPE